MGHFQMPRQVGEPPFVLRKSMRLYRAGPDSGPATSAQQLADDSGIEGLSAFGRAVTIAVELIGDLVGSELLIAQFKDAGQELLVVV